MNKKNPTAVDTSTAEGHTKKSAREDYIIMGWKTAPPDLPDPPPARGLARFIIILVFVGLGLVLGFGILGRGTTPEPEPIITATPTAVAGVNVSTAVDSSPSVSVNVEQVAPAPAPPAPPDNTAALMANDAARDARLVADNAAAHSLALAPRVAAVETRVAALDAAVPPSLVKFEQQTAATTATMSRLSGVLMGALIGLFLLCCTVGWLVMRPPTLPRGYTIDHRPDDYDQNHPEPARTRQNRSAVPLVEPYRTVQNGSERFQLEPVRTDAKLDPNGPMTRAERQQILYWWKSLNSYSAVARLLYGSKNGNTFNRVKHTIEEVAHD